MTSRLILNSFINWATVLNHFALVSVAHNFDLEASHTSAIRRDARKQRAESHLEISAIWREFFGYSEFPHFAQSAEWASRYELERPAMARAMERGNSLRRKDKTASRCRMHPIPRPAGLVLESDAFFDVRRCLGSYIIEKGALAISNKTMFNVVVPSPI